MQNCAVIYPREFRNDSAGYFLFAGVLFRRIKLFESRTRDECLARAHNFPNAASPDQIDNGQPGQASLARSLNNVNPLGRIKFFLFEAEQFLP